MFSQSRLTEVHIYMSSENFEVDVEKEKEEEKVQQISSPSFFERNEQPIKVFGASLILLLTALFINFSNPGHGKGRPIIRNHVRESSSYIMPFTDASQGVHHPVDDGIREKAVMVTLSRNRDLWQLLQSIRDVEDRFNNRYHYDWVFLNDVPFTDEFKRVTSAMVSGKTKYGLIDEDQWSVPPWIDEAEFEERRKWMEAQEVPYGGMVPYRHMCRYQSGFIWRHPLLDEYDYYWRVDTDIRIYCDIQYDIFKFMRENKKKYGFILSLSEYEATIPTFWDTVKKFVEDHRI